MTPHRVDSYKDGCNKVTFCVLCGAEGEQLLDPCPGEPEEEKPIDKDTKRS